MAVITDSQFNILKNEIRDNINLKAKLKTLLDEVREVVSFEIHDASKSMSKCSLQDIDVELYKDYDALDSAAWTPDYIDLITLDALRELVNKTVTEEVAKNIVDHTEETQNDSICSINR